MDFYLNSEQSQIKAMAEAFAAEHLQPFAAEWDAKEFFPVATLRQAATLGFAGLFIGEEFGGCNLTRLDGALIFEALAQGCVASSAYLSIHNMVGGMIQRFGTKEQQQRWLPKLSSLQWLSSYCLTEPASGSDAASLKTKAERDGDCYVLNGAKAFISGGGVSDLYLVMVRTGDAGAKGVSAVIVEKGTPGLSFGKKEEKMGWRSQPTCVVNFDDCRIPISNRLGNEGDGFKIAMTGLDGGRINIAACSLGGAQRALDLAKAYIKERRQFGQKLADFQALQFKIADMETELSAARLMVYRAGFMLSQKDPEATLYCAMAKRFATDVGFKVVNEALQLHGGYGYIREYQVERLVRDLRVHQILEGTNEIMRHIIARKVLD
ncbi:acyl-CoA dehydrogenase family protein [Candidatus Odyssella thessalonicensis]|uniref:acyl-CoA dehydrogenase family protein n=1 Tax=Candidatus Odyssella thessalonicensis TaxID=84647 RepID=UPI000225BDA2|nr:acyl-CoA dehydrogenase family protein [Candidatus Odyssella thessalonicensis]